MADISFIRKSSPCCFKVNNPAGYADGFQVFDFTETGLRCAISESIKIKRLKFNCATFTVFSDLLKQ
ncbi:MAG: hypothetical protein AB7S75_02125 [Desulfococcaceae bacterium]